MRVTKIGRILLFLGTLLPLAACSSMGGGGASSCSEPSIEVAQVSVYPSQSNVVAGVPTQLVTQATNACGYEISNVNYVWKSRNLSIARVDARGNLSASSTGTVEIEATAVSVGGNNPAAGGGVVGTATVTVISAPFSGVVHSIEIYPVDPVVLVQTQRQMVAVAYDDQGNQITDATFSWLTDHPEIADITNTGLVTANQVGLAAISVQATGSASIAWASTDLIVVEENGGPLPDPAVTITPFGVVMGVGDVREVRVSVTAPYTGNTMQVPITWSATPTGYITILPLGENGEIARLTGTVRGSVELTAAATLESGVVTSAPILVNVLLRATGVSGEWEPTTPLPVPLYGHGMSLVKDRLFVTGGVAGVPIWGGPREDVRRGLLDAYSGFVTNRDGEEGWDHSEQVYDPDPISQVLGECTLDPVCMVIERNGPVHYQVFRHAQVATGTHIYVLGGIDAQVDLGISGEPSEQVGPDLTRFSDRVLIGEIGTNGALGAWYEGSPLPTVGYYLGGYEDVAGRSDLAAAIYDSKWLYAMGGWSWVRKKDFEGNYTYIGRNREEIFRAAILPNGDLGPWVLDGRLPDPLNKHAAAVVGDWLYISGGAYGTGESAEVVSDRVFKAKINPVGTDDGIPDGSLGSWEVVLPNLQRALQGHSMVVAPGGTRLVVVGGNNLTGASSEAYLSGVSLDTGAIGDWLLLPLLPHAGGLTEHAAISTLYQTVGGGVLRVVIAGGGTPLAGDISNLDRTRDVYYLDIGP